MATPELSAQGGVENCLFRKYAIVAGSLQLGAPGVQAPEPARCRNKNEVWECPNVVSIVHGYDPEAGEAAWRAEAHTTEGAAVEICPVLASCIVSDYDRDDKGEFPSSEFGEGHPIASPVSDGMSRVCLEFRSTNALYTEIMSTNDGKARCKLGVLTSLASDEDAMGMLCDRAFGLDIDGNTQDARGACLLQKSTCIVPTRVYLDEGGA